MAYEKIPEVVENEVVVSLAKIRFYYPTQKIFNQLSLRTHYRSKMIKDADGKSQLDEIAISQDELDITKDMLERAIFSIGNSFFKMAQGVENSIFFDSLLPVPDSSPEENELEEASSGFEIIDHMAYNVNLIPAIDKEIENTIREFCLREWFSIVGIVPDYQLHDLAFNNSLKKVENLTFQLRKPLMS
jgi:hypothetical protein